MIFILFLIDYAIQDDYLHGTGKVTETKRKIVFMKINNTEIVDTYAEAFSMWSAKVIITAENDYWAEGAARAMTGMATSVIGVKQV